MHRVRHEDRQVTPEEGWAGTGIRETRGAGELQCPRSVTTTKPSQSPRPRRWLRCGGTPRQWGRCYLHTHPGYLPVNKTSSSL